MLARIQRRLSKLVLIHIFQSQTSDLVRQTFVQIDVHGQVGVDEDTYTAVASAIACSKKQFFSSPLDGVQRAMPPRIA